MAPTDETQSPEDSLQLLLEKARKGAGAEGAKRWLDQYLWAAMWRDIVLLSNAEPKLEILLARQQSLKAKIQLAQELNLDVSNSELAVGRLRKAYTTEERKGEYQ